MSEQGPGLGYWLRTFVFAVICVGLGVGLGAGLPPPWGLVGVLPVLCGFAWVVARTVLQPRDSPAPSIGWPALLVAIATLAHYPILLASAMPWFGPGAESPEWVPVFTLGPAGIIGSLLGVSLLVVAGRRPTGTPGRVRARFLAIGTSLRSIGYLALSYVLYHALSDPNAFLMAFGLEESLMPIGQMPAFAESLSMVTGSQGTYPWLLTGVILALAGAAVETLSLLSCWFLLPLGPRRWFWSLFDLGLVAAFVWATAELPIQPAALHPEETILPAVRLAITSAFVARILVRLLPLFLDAVEHLGFTVRVAARMMRAQKSGFLTTIGALSIMAVSFSSCTLTTTLSVMGGFRNDLKETILGNNAHVVVDREDGNFEGWDPVLQTVRGQPDVLAATPYLQGEVMITSATNLGGAVLRGIDPETISDVTHLRRNLRHGLLEYLTDPERLTRLAPSVMGAGLLSPLADTGPRLDPQHGSLFDDVDQVLEDALARRPDAPHAPAGDAPGDEPTAAGLGARERPSSPDLTAAAPPTRDVLPGLIVGQELARTLRLHVGDEVNVVSPLGELGPTGPIPKSRPFRVAGIFYSGMYEFDMKMAYTTLEVAQRFLNVGDAITGIEIRVEGVEAAPARAGQDTGFLAFAARIAESVADLFGPDGDRAQPVAAALRRVLGERLRVRAWQEVNRNLFGALQLEKLAMFITLGIAILVASFCVVGTLSLMVQEKRREVGILKAMGSTRRQIVAVFMTMGLMIGTLGASVGLGLGYLACFVGEHYGVRLNPDVYYIDRLPVHIDVGEFAATWIAAVVVCLLATIYPAILGSRLTPLDALRSS